MKKVKVLIIDDSALIRKTITEILKNEPSVDVVGTALNPFFAVEKIQTLKPDVLLLDIQMPQMDGLTFLQKLMTQQPMPVVIFSSYVEDGSRNAMRALELGAVDVIEKPRIRTSEELSKYKNTLLNAIKAASISNVLKQTRSFKSKIIIPVQPKELEKKSLSKKINPDNFIIAIGASTGGTEAIRRILEHLPLWLPPIVITQHMPAGFTKSFSERLNQLSKIRVKEAAEGDHLEQGCAYIARGDRHLEIKKINGKFFAHLSDSQPVNRHKPSVEVLFDSVAKNFGHNSLGIILTGMGGDGAEGLKRMKQKGAHTIAQDEYTCVVFGMPKVAIDIGAVDTILPIFKIAEYIVEHLSD